MKLKISSRHAKRYFGCLALALLFALLPLALLLTGSTTQCQDSKALSANPFSSDNLCRVRKHLVSLWAKQEEEPRAGSQRYKFMDGLENTRPHTANTTHQAAMLPPQQQQEQQQQLQDQRQQPVLQGSGTEPSKGSTPQDSNDSDDQQGEPAVLEPKLLEEKDVLLNSQQKSGQPPTEQQQQQQDPKQQEGPGQQQQSTPRPPPASPKKVNLLQQRRGGISHEEHKHKATEAVARRQDMTPKDYVRTLFDAEMPQTEEDLERIKRYPHVTECNLCKVCIPEHVVKQEPMQDGPTFVGRRRMHGAAASTSAQGASSSHFSGGATGGSGGSSSSHAGPGRSWDDILQVESYEDDGSFGREDDPSTWPSNRASAGSSSPCEAQGAEDAGSSSSSSRCSRRSLLNDRDHMMKREDTESDPLYRVQNRVYNLTMIAPGNKLTSRQHAHLPNCSICWGCKHTLEMMASGTMLAGSYYAHEPGGSPSWLFRVRTNKAASGWAVVKVWCVPVLKIKQRGFAPCAVRRVYSQVKLLLAQQKLISECGFQDVVPRVWVEPVLGVLPGHGYRINWLGLWADMADGVSVQNLQEAGRPRTKPDVLINLLSSRINHTQIRKAALFDLMFSQCDRHQQNLFLNEQGRVSLIDNDLVFSTAWRKCGVDSLVVPTTQKFMINHAGFFYVLKFPVAKPPKTWSGVLNPLLMLDYRCHVEGGEIGKGFEPAHQQCMQRLAGMNEAQIQAHYGYPNLKMAAAIHNRSRDMLAHGYEWALYHGEPMNLPQHRYKLPKPCCKMGFNRTDQRFFCLTPWEPMLDLPFGNPWHGGKWHGPPGLDTGNYVGGPVV